MKSASATSRAEPCWASSLTSTWLATATCTSSAHTPPTCRQELLDRTPIWNQRHLLHALREYEAFYNPHRPHQGIVNARPLRRLPQPITDPDRLAHLNIRR